MPVPVPTQSDYVARGAVAAIPRRWGAQPRPGRVPGATSGPAEGSALGALDAAFQLVGIRAVRRAEGQMVTALPVVLVGVPEPGLQDRFVGADADVRPERLGAGRLGSVLHLPVTGVGTVRQRYSGEHLAVVQLRAGHPAHLALILRGVEALTDHQVVDVDGRHGTRGRGRRPGAAGLVVGFVRAPTAREGKDEQTGVEDDLQAAQHQPDHGLGGPALLAPPDLDQGGDAQRDRHRACQAEQDPAQAGRQRGDGEPVRPRLEHARVAVTARIAIPLRWHPVRRWWPGRRLVRPGPGVRLLSPRMTPIRRSLWGRTAEGWARLG